MGKKKRLPIEQLRAAGRAAREMLVERGLVAKDSVLDEIVKMEDAPTLPGIPNYLPHQWTIKAAQQIMYDLLLIWREKNKGNTKKTESITEFFKFVVKEMRSVEKKFDKEDKAMPKMFAAMKEVPVLKDVFSPMRKRENVRAIHRFFVDSFAVAIVLKNNHSTSEYANWFLDWTQDLYALWVSPDERKKMERV